MPRLFIGIPLPESYRQGLKPLTDCLDAATATSVNWSRPDNWHLTLKFLGDTEQGRIPAIMAALAAIEFPAFALQAGGAGAFPNPKQPRVLWLGLAQGGEQCTDLAEEVENELNGIGVAREKKRFRPHLTLGRIRKPGPGNWQAVLAEANQSRWPRFTVDRFVLWQSKLASTGAVHIKLAKFYLR